MGYGGDLVEVREKELANSWGSDAFCLRTLGTFGLVRTICFSDLVADIQVDGCQLILLGEAVAMVTKAIAYCASSGIDTLAYGATGYQGRLPEQRPRSIDVFSTLAEDVGVRFVCPLVKHDEASVKNELMLFGLSTKSLEAQTVLSDLEDDPPDSAVSNYLSRKSAWASRYLADLNGSGMVES